MQIVIDIPDEMFDWYDNGFPDEDDAEKLWQIVKNGTPLPKGHGRLIDADVLVAKLGTYKRDMDLWEMVIAEPTIIEADKENE